WKSLSISMLTGFYSRVNVWHFWGRWIGSAVGAPRRRGFEAGMKIAGGGTGYVGVVVGACLAETGNDVVCVDKIDAEVRMLRRGRMPSYEPGLEELVQRNTKKKRLSFTTQLAKAVRTAEIIFVAVGTPQGEDGSADLRHVLDVAKEIARAMNGYKVIVDKS